MFLRSLGDFLGSDVTVAQGVSVLNTYTLCFSAIIIAMIIIIAVVIGINRGRK